MFEEAEPLPWVELYRQALLELAPDMLAKRLAAAETAMKDRLLAISQEAGAGEERRAIRDARQNMRVLYDEIASSSPQEQTRFHSHPEMAGDLVAFVDASRRYVAVTDGVCDLLGYSRAELLHLSIDQVTDPEVRETVPEAFQRYLSLGAMEGAFSLLAKDGRRIAIRYWARVFPDGCMVARWEPLERAAHSAA
jgi:PAS domain S-box-containing protein